MNGRRTGVYRLQKQSTLNTIPDIKLCISCRTIPLPTPNNTGHALIPRTPTPQSLDSRIASGALPTDLDAAIPPPPSLAPAAREPAAASRDTLASRSRRALAVLDGMAACEVAWHEGGSLPETLYACLYLHPVVFSAVLGGLGWEAPALGAVGGVYPRLDLGIKDGEG